MSWTQIWIFPPHKESYCLDSLYAPTSCFLAQRMRLIFSVIRLFLCQTNAVIILEPRLFETGKESSWGDFIADCRLVYSRIRRLFVVCISFFWCSCLEAPIYTTICMTVKHVFERDLTCLTQLFKIFPYSFLTCTPNLFWARGHLLWCTRIADPSGSKKIGGTR